MTVNVVLVGEDIATALPVGFFQTLYGILSLARVSRIRQRFRYGKTLHPGGSRVTLFYDGKVKGLAV